MAVNRKLVFSTDHYYHVYNRGVEKRQIFGSKRDYNRFLEIINYYRFVSPPVSYSQYLLLEKSTREKYLSNLQKSKKFVSILSFCLMPNHFHFLFQQTTDQGITTFISKISNSYARYFNTKYQRVGPLYQGPFKAVFIENEEQLIHVSRYIHLNPIISSIVNRSGLPEYNWSSFPNYIGTDKRSIVETNTIMSLFLNQNKYLDFIYNQIDYAKKLSEIKHLTFEE